MRDRACQGPRQRKQRVLVVGSGGIGCEIIKILSSIRHISLEIELVDLDTIEISNLHRQFLFHSEHVGQSKALVASSQITRYRPEMHGMIVSHHRNIIPQPSQSPVHPKHQEAACHDDGQVDSGQRFDVQFYRSFDVVVNALDNIDARRHVNMMCLFADVPLVDAGTAGLVGQVSTVCRCLTECYDCTGMTSSDVMAAYPVCTIRQTPSTIIHCVVWAKDHLLPSLFVKSPSEDNLWSLFAGSGSGDEEAAKKNSNMVAKKVFYDDVRQLAEKEDLWKDGRQRPVPLHLYEKERHNLGSSDDISCKDDDWMHRVLSLEDSLALFLSSLRNLCKNFGHTDGKDDVSLFDKDDQDMVNMVGAASNIRATIFGISPQSIFSIKAIAGRIIPAVVTTNAVVSGVAVLHLQRLIRAKEKGEGKRHGSGDAQNSKSLLPSGTSYYSPTTLPSILMSERSVRRPSPDCKTCSCMLVVIKARKRTSTLGGLVLCLEEKARVAPSFTLMQGSRTLYDPDFTDLLSKTLEDISIYDGCTLMIIPDDEEDRPGRPIYAHISLVDSGSVDCSIVYSGTHDAHQHLSKRLKK